MGLDGELALWLDGRDGEADPRLRGLRQTLLAEHLGVDVAAVAAAEDRRGFAGTLDAFGDRDPGLRELEADPPSPLIEDVIALCDPEGPVGIDRFLELFGDSE